MLARDEPQREGGLFGYFGGAVNVTDGRYTYHRYPADLRKPGDLPVHGDADAHLRAFHAEELSGATLSEPIAVHARRPAPQGAGHRPLALVRELWAGACSRTRRVSTISRRIPGRTGRSNDPAIEARMLALMKDMMHANDGPPEAFVRLGLDPKP